MLQLLSDGRSRKAAVRLPDPPFEHSSPGPGPGYIQGCVRGVRESGGQYTHATVWAAMAFAAQGDGQRAWELLALLTPIQHAKPAQVGDVHKAEPCVVAGDVHALPPQAGRGGWTWYTGPAGWWCRLILAIDDGAARTVVVRLANTGDLKCRSA
jgi:cellobiose phosphorylase